MKCEYSNRKLRSKKRKIFLISRMVAVVICLFFLVLNVRAATSRAHNFQFHIHFDHEVFGNSHLHPTSFPMSWQQSEIDSLIINASIASQNNSKNYPIFNWWIASVFFAPSDQTNWMKTNSFCSTGSRVTINSMAIWEEVTVNSHRRCSGINQICCVQRGRILVSLWFQKIPWTGPDSKISTIMSVSLFNEYAGPTLYRLSRGTFVGKRHPAEDKVAWRWTRQWVGDASYGIHSSSTRLQTFVKSKFR